MQVNPRYDDVVTEVYDFLAHRVEWAEAHGIPRERIAVDPGIGFGKTVEHNLEILRNLERFDNLGCVILVGTSRKGFLGTITGRPVAERAAASAASSLAACLRGARVVRVHDVAPMVDTIRVWTALRGWEDSHMSTVVEVDECDEPSTRMITLSLCRTMAEEAKLASRQLAVARERPRTPGCAGRPPRLLDRREEILAANARDVAGRAGAGLERRGDRPADA